MDSEAAELLIRRIREDEIGEVSLILEEAALWLKREGRDMWTEKQYSVRGLLDSYTVADMYLGFLDQQAVATMVLQEKDLLFGADDHKPCLYLHKLAARRSYARTGMAAQMITWAKRMAAARGKHTLRLDCAADRPRLCEFYEKQGFVKVREALILNQYPTAFYEIRID
ncbi:GNAT family N-acetyltransferase [Paenibacillus hodogayensis]|uniref:GNAT family N-acetyltransferase n=1 Tax=Paenibacillus hodogayensis TaxID=279208 RepID=A0ABV5VW19_9BACL